jgi:peptide-O-fucosyltransferase
LQVRVVTRKPENAQVSMAILTLADYFIGNCLSSFHAFVKRARDVNQLPTGFWAVEDARISDK